MEPKSTDSGEGKNLYDKYGMPISVLLGLGLIAGAIYYGGGAPPVVPQGNQPVQGGTGTPVDIAKVNTVGSPSVGSLTAPVVIAYWFDYQCPFCQRFDQQVMGKLYEKYVKTGQVRIIFKDFQFLSEDSTTAGKFARAVYEAYPDKFFAWYQMMFEKQDEEHGGFGDQASIVAATKEAGLGIDTARIEQLITTNGSAYETAMNADKEEGAKFGVSGTPSTLIGNALLPGAQPYETVESAIKAELGN